MNNRLAGSWDTVANHQANLYGGKISAAASVDWYISQGVKREKIVLGLPLYGRSFLNTEGPGYNYSGMGPGTWENGVYDYRVLPLPGSSVKLDKTAVASWSYDTSKKEMISYDSEEVAKLKGQYIKKEKLGGSMFWELSGDKGPAREGMETGDFERRGYRGCGSKAVLRRARCHSKKSSHDLSD